MGNSSYGPREAGHPGCAAAGGRLAKVQVIATPILEVAGVKAYHTSVAIGRKEYFFDADGIITAPALWSHTGIDGKDSPTPSQQQQLQGTPLTEVIDVGLTPVLPEAFMRAMAPFFPTGTYDIILKNCNTFSDAALYFLTRTRIEGRFCRLERLIATARPFSTRLLSVALQGVQDAHTPIGYSVNPLAENFSVEDIVVACDTADVARWGHKVGKGSGASSCCSPTSTWGIAGCCQACEVLTMETTSTSVENGREYAPDTAEGVDPEHLAHAAELLPVRAAMSSVSMSPTPLSSTRHSLSPEKTRSLATV